MTRRKIFICTTLFNVITGSSPNSPRFSGSVGLKVTSERNERLIYVISFWSNKWRPLSLKSWGKYRSTWLLSSIKKKTSTESVAKTIVESDKLLVDNIQGLIHFRQGVFQVPTNPSIIQTRSQFEFYKTKTTALLALGRTSIKLIIAFRKKT